jgi:putative flavoprotein involved in K+ transport
MTKAPQGQVSGVGPRGKSISLQYLHKKGAVILGHLVNVKENIFVFRDDAAENVKEGDQFSMKVKTMIDQFISENRMLTPPATLDEGDEADPNTQCVSHITSIDAEKENITSVIWTTGFSADFSWLRSPVFDSMGEPIHNGGRSPVPGLYFIGFPWLRSRKSGYHLRDE